MNAISEALFNQVVDGMLELFSQRFDPDDIFDNPGISLNPKSVDRVLKIQLGKDWRDDMVDEMMEWIETGLEEYFASRQ